MTKDVLITISGLQMAVSDVENEDNEPIEVISAGTYYFKDGKHYIFFEEVAEGIPGVTKAQIRLKGKETLEVIKKGVLDTHMIFEKYVTHACTYQTPIGQLEMGIRTSSLSVEESEENIDIQAEYTLQMDFEPVAECMIRINVKPKGSKDFSIL